MNDNGKRREALTGYEFADGEALEALARLVDPQIPDGVEWPVDADGLLIDPSKTYEYNGKTARIHTLGYFGHQTASEVEIELNGGEDYSAVDPKTLHRLDSIDTWERIEADALKPFAAYWRCENYDCSECPSVVDGQNPKERYKTNFCGDASRLDLVARCKALAEKEAGR